MFQRKIALLLFILIACNAPVFAQVNVQEHSPKKASISSAILPGSGQYYNEKYWKIPVIYVGLAAALYSANQNQVNIRTTIKPMNFGPMKTLIQQMNMSTNTPIQIY